MDNKTCGTCIWYASYGLDRDKGMCYAPLPVTLRRCINFIQLETTEDYDASECQLYREDKPINFNHKGD